MNGDSMMMMTERLLNSSMMSVSGEVDLEICEGFSCV